MRDEALLRGELNAFTPRLRRYARALVTGHAAPSELADDLVHATLIRALGARNVVGAASLKVRLYATVTQLHREMALSGQQARAANSGRTTALISTPQSGTTTHPTELAGALMGLPIEAREAILLVGLEGMNYADAARVLRISKSVLISRLTLARHALDGSLQPGRSSASAALGRPAGRASHLRLVT